MAFLILTVVVLCMVAVHLHTRATSKAIERAAFPFFVRGFGGDTLEEALLKERRWILARSFTRAPLAVRRKGAA